MKIAPKIIYFAAVAAVLGGGGYFLFQHYCGSSRVTHPADATPTNDRASRNQNSDVTIPQAGTASTEVAEQSDQGTPDSSGSATAGNQTLVSSSPGLERIRLVLASDGTVGFAQRVKILRAIKTKLTNQEIDALYRYVQLPSKDSGDRAKENWLRNDMMDKLLMQETAPAGLADLFVGIYQDRNQDRVMRDYAIQHMSPVYDQANLQERASIQSALWDATTETSSSIGGTALLAIMDVSQADRTIDRTRLAEIALRLATDNNVGELTRITAVQICGRMGVGPALPVIQSVSEQGPTIPLRIAATAALGDYAMNAGRPGADEARTTLVRIAGTTEPRQAVAAESALQRINRSQITLTTSQNNNR